MIKKLIYRLCQIPFWKNFLYKLTSYIHFRKDLKELDSRIKNEPDTLLLVFTPEHGNLGDHAIALAEIEFLDAMGIKYIEIPQYLLRRIRDYKLLKFFNHKKILLHGGGYLGTLWFYEEELLRKIIKKAPDSRIYALPNTIYYEDSAFGKKEFEKSKHIYNAHKSLTLCARENVSYDIMKDAYNNVKLIPDMVLTLNKCVAETERNGCLLCLRNDLEKTLTDKEKESVQSIAGELFGENVGLTDMCIDCNISPKDRVLRLEEKFRQFRSSELVITDRLHGMIFCAITGTPCIVLNSKSPKVKGCYKWIEASEYIKFADNISDIPDIYNNIPEKNFTYDNSHLKEYYDILKSDILNLLQ